MNIHVDDAHLTLEFPESAQRWSLLVIDDHWDSVKAMVVGETDDVSGIHLAGLGAASIDDEKVLAYWNALKHSPEEILEIALMLIPWAVASTDGFRSVTFCDFPGSPEKLIPILTKAGLSRPATAEGMAGFDEPCATLIDIRDLSEGEERFQETWTVLDELLHPVYARAKFTRGGATLPPEFDWVEKIRKEPPQGGWSTYRADLHSWLQRLKGHIDDKQFQRLTRDSCSHNPSTLGATPAFERQSVALQLAAMDPYGVWRWAAEEAVVDPLPLTAPSRWLAGKAFQTWPPTRTTVPAVALIALCEGARRLFPAGRFAYSVYSPLDKIAPRDFDSLRALGAVQLSRGEYQDFAPALRHWLAQPEQFAAGKARLRRITVSIGNDLVVECRYSAALPHVIFAPASETRTGRVWAAWQALAPFMARHEHQGSVVRMFFTLSA
jgi:hypothetical protein